ncbi:MAG: hypothetical protein R3Y59_00230 [bacterium]
MKTKQLILIIALCAVSIVSLQAENYRFKTDVNVGYEFLQSKGSSLNTEILLKNKFDNWSLDVGTKITYDNLYVALLLENKLYSDDKRYTAIQTKFLGGNSYNNLDNYTQTIAISALYDQEYFSIALGLLSTYNFTDLQVSNSKLYTRYNDFIYDINARIFKKDHIWNLGGQITNSRIFEVDKYYNPFFILNGEYKIKLNSEGERLRVYSRLGFQLQPVYIMNAPLDDVSVFFNIGVEL